MSGQKMTIRFRFSKTVRNLKGKKVDGYIMCLMKTKKGKSLTPFLMFVNVLRAPPKRIKSFPTLMYKGKQK